MHLTTHFTLAEFTASQAAARARPPLDNTPPAAVYNNIRSTAIALEVVRVALGHPIIISSGYRSDAVNRAVGGAASSGHKSGWAVDFICPSFGRPLDVCREIVSANIPYDLLIHEFGAWVHISFAPALRRQALTIDRLGTRTGLLEIRP